MTDAVRWAQTEFAARLARMEAGMVRDCECFRRSAECILRSQELLSQPIPKIWPEQR
jgi:hypothetical protein